MAIDESADSILLSQQKHEVNLPTEPVGTKCSPILIGDKKLPIKINLMLCLPSAVDIS